MRMEAIGEETTETTALEDGVRASKAKARWKKLRAATCVFILFRRRTMHGVRQQKLSRKAIPVFLGERNGRGASVFASTLFSPRGIGSSPHVAKLYAMKLERFECLLQKPIQNRSDIDIKLLAEFIRNTRFFTDLSSASIDALARHIRFCEYHEGEVLYRQGDTIHEVCGRCMVIRGSVFVYRNSDYVQSAREGEDYTGWYLNAVPGSTREAIKYGDCIDTCNIGDIFGDDAVYGNLFRERTVIAQENSVIACIIRTDYQQTVRFNIPNDNQVIDHVRHIFIQQRGARRSSRAPLGSSSANSRSAPSSGHDFKQDRTLMRFLARFHCFRILPQSLWPELTSKMNLIVAKCNDVLCYVGDSDPCMFMVLEGSLCVHAQQSYEETKLQHDQVRSYRAGLSASKPDQNDCLSGCEVSGDVMPLVRDSLHICSISAGDSFGEAAISNEKMPHEALIYHPVAKSDTCSVLCISRQNYQTVLQQHVDNSKLNLDAVCSILSRTKPQDRTDEQIMCLKTYLMQTSSVKLFFHQLPSSIMDMLLRHAHLEQHAVADEIAEFIQKEDEPIEMMRVILNGYVGVFKSNLQSTKGEEISTSRPQAVAPKRAVLRRYQSRLIRANTHILDGNGTESGCRGSIVKKVLNMLPPPPALAEQSDATTVDPVSILSPGAAFGHLQIFTRSNSPYSYAAFALTQTGEENDKTNMSGAAAMINIICIPARIVRIALSKIDEYIVYNPARLIKRFVYGHETSRRNGQLVAVKGSMLARLFHHHPIFCGIPISVTRGFLDSMDIVQIPPDRIIYEHAEAIRARLFVVLSGTVRTFTYGVKTRRRRDSMHTEDKRAKFPRKALNDGGPKSSDKHGDIVFDKVAGDGIFLSDYDQTLELGMGDCFGRHGSIGRNGRNEIAPLPRRTSNMPHQTVPGYPETVVTMSECHIGVLGQRAPTCPVSSDERRLLVRRIRDQEDTDQDQSNRTSFSALSSSFAILDTMNLAHRLTTNQRVQAAMSLRYRGLTTGDIVFKEGHEGQAIYIILFGKIRLCTMRASEAKTSGGSNDLHGELVIELGEGDVFGEEAFWDMYGSTRSSTAIAGLDEVETEILYLTRADYDTIIGCGLRSNQRTNNTVVPMKFFSLQQQHMTAADRWRMAIYQVIHCRTSRSQWLSVISMAHERRIDLLFDIVMPLFTDTPRHQIKQLCRSAVLRTFGADSIVYSRGDTMVDECFLVVSGSVALQQTFFGAGNNNAGLANANNPSSTDTTSVKVTIHVVESGGIFGEFETLGNCSKRHISVVVLQPDTKLLLLPAEDFVSFWPEKSRLDAKLALLKSQIRSVCRLDLDQTCSLYYAAHHQSYRRNDVISGKQEQEGVLHVIEEGVCVVHDSVALKRKDQNATSVARSPSRVAFDARVAMLSAGSILFTEKPEPVSDNRRASTRTLDAVDIASAESKSTQYTVADSPVVTTCSIQLFPKRPPVAGFRGADLFVMMVLGKSGLQRLRDTMTVQLKWRTENVIHSGQLLAEAMTQPGRGSPAQDRGVIPEPPPSNRWSKPSSYDLTRLLVQRSQRESDEADGRSSPSTRQPRPSPRIHAFNSFSSIGTSTLEGSYNAPTSPRLILGSFSPTSSPDRRIMPSLVLPTLTSPSFSMPWTPPTSPRATEKLDIVLEKVQQVRREEVNLAKTLKPPFYEQIQKNTKDLQIRRRHGRPPPKRVENTGKFIDEHAISPFSVKDEHDRKKSGLCRRLLHVKGSPHK